MNRLAKTFWLLISVIVITTLGLGLYFVYVGNEIASIYAGRVGAIGVLVTLVHVVLASFAFLLFAFGFIRDHAHRRVWFNRLVIAALMVVGSYVVDNMIAENRLSAYPDSRLIGQSKSPQTP